MFKSFIGAILITFTAQTGFCLSNDDSALVAAVKSRKRVNFVEAANLVATQLLPDDTKGLPHQKWQAQLSDGSTITVIYNSNVGYRVPIKVGDRFGVGGQYIPAGRTGIIHWLHEDPKRRRPAGYVYLNGITYGGLDRKLPLFYDQFSYF